MKKSLFLLLLLAIFATSWEKDKGTINDTADIIGEWECVGIDFYYDGELVYSLTPDSKDYFYYYYKDYSYYVSNYSAISFEEDDDVNTGFVFNDNGKGYQWWISKDYTDENYYFSWFYQNNRIAIFDDEDGEYYEDIYISGNYITEEYYPSALGYYISDTDLDLNWIYQDIQDMPNIDWKGQDGQEHEMKEVYKYAKQ